MQINYDRKQKSDIVISRPSAIEVEKYLKSWNNLKNYKLQEDALDKLFFELLPRNEEISDILLKVATLIFIAQIFFQFIQLQSIY